MSIYDDIKTKPIILVGQGPSVQRLKENIDLFKCHDVLWGSLNRFHVSEEEILRVIDVDFDILWFSALLRYEEMHEHLKRAGSRGSLIMTKAAVAEYLDFPAHMYSSDFGTGFSSLFAMLCALIKLGAQNIYLIGFDGHAINSGDVYYGQKKMHLDDYKSRMRSIARDTKMMNIFFWEYVEYAINVSRHLINITNLFGSALACFPRVEIDTIAKRSGNGLCSAPIEKKTYSTKGQMVEVRVLRFFISPQFGNVDEGMILKLTQNQVKVFVANGLVKVIPPSPVKEPDSPAATVKRKTRKKRARRKVRIKKVDSYYTMEHPELLIRLSKIFKVEERMSNEA